MWTMFGPIFSFLTPTGSEKSLWTDNMNFRLRISVFWTPKGCKNGEFPKFVVNTAKGSYKYHLYQIWAFKPQPIPKNCFEQTMCIFGYKFRCFWPPWGVKKAIFKKSLKPVLEGHMNNICIKFQLSNPYRFREITADGQTDRHNMAIV